MHNDDKVMHHLELDEWGSLHGDRDWHGLQGHVVLNNRYRDARWFVDRANGAEGRRVDRGDVGVLDCTATSTQCDLHSDNLAERTDV